MTDALDQIAADTVAALRRSGPALSALIDLVDEIEGSAEALAADARAAGVGMATARVQSEKITDLAGKAVYHLRHADTELRATMAQLKRLADEMTEASRGRQ